MNLSKQFERYTENINIHLHHLLDNKEGKIYDAMRYSLYAGGKRVRPVLTALCSEALGGNEEAALCFGCALEAIHTYSLVHDDLPCMDNDDLRRGKPTNHIVFGEDIAVLAGDALLNFACESIAGAKNIDAAMKIDALRILFTASGAEGMIGGQVMDINAEKEFPDEKALSILHSKKTGALIRAAASLGAISAKANPDLFDEYATSLGLAFQIQDDILDVVSSVEKFGKPIRSDEKNSKVTYVTLFGTDGAKRRLQEETDKAISSISFLGSKGEKLRDFAMYLLNREH